MDKIKGICEMAQANCIKVILSSTLPLYDYPWKPELNPSGKIIALNKMIKTYSTFQGHISLDCFSAMVDDLNELPEKYAEVEVPPTVAGYKVMEPLVETAIKQALSE